VLSFAGFESATTLGEEAQHPVQSIPMAVLGTVIAASLFFVVASYAQVVGYGFGHVQELGQANVPLDELATRFISGAYAALLDFAATISALACTIGSLSAAARMLYALSRVGLVPNLAALDPKHRTPVRSVVVMSAANLACLLLRGARSDAPSYSGNVVTIGTLGLILVYISVTGAQAIEAFRSRLPVWCTIGALGTLLLLWPRGNSLYPAPPWPADPWPYIVAAYLVLGSSLVLFLPSVTRSEFMALTLSIDLGQESNFSSDRLR
jgi:amino acid transporter